MSVTAWMNSPTRGLLSGLSGLSLIATALTAQFENLSVGGPYLLEVRAAAFRPTRQAGVILSLGHCLTTDLTLTPSLAVLAPIEVVAPVDPLINAGRTGPAKAIPESILSRLPVPNRDFSQLALLSPQVVQSPAGSLSIAGQPDRLNGLQIDGAPNNDLLGGSGLGTAGTAGQEFGVRTLPVEAIKELQVISAPFDVRFGNFAAGLINADTRSGSNRFEAYSAADPVNNGAFPCLWNQLVAAYHTGRLTGVQSADERRARIAVLRGARDRAVALLREARSGGSNLLQAVHHDPDLEALRNYPPLATLLRLGE